MGDAEALDVAAATAVVRAETGLPIVAIGFSMGAAAVIRSAALLEPADAVVAVSSPAEWQDRRRQGSGARRTALLLRVPGALTTARALTRVRLSGHIPTGGSPRAVVGRIAPVPVLIVHGTSDPFFPPEEAVDLYGAAGEPKGLWIVPGGGHAEGLFSGRPAVVPEVVDSFVDDLLRRLGPLLAGQGIGANDEPSPGR